MKRVHLFISGNVQGVSFRHYTKKKACELGVNGWVRNLYDGRVEVLTEGEDENVDRLVEWCHHGPSLAEVENVKIDTEPCRGDLKDFQVALEKWIE